MICGKKISIKVNGRYYETVMRPVILYMDRTIGQ